MSPDSIATALAPNAGPAGPDAGTPAAKPFLSIITRTQGRRPHTLAEVLTCLAAQTDTDFEILIIGHRLDDETVNVAGERGSRAKGVLNMPYPAKFNFFDHVIENRSPPLSTAFPREVIDANALRFDETLTTTEGWDFTMRLACLVE